MNSKDVALFVSTFVPYWLSKMVFMSISPPHPVPVSEVPVKSLGPSADTAKPDDKIIPSSNGKFEPPSLKYPQLRSERLEVPSGFSARLVSVMLIQELPLTNTC